MYAYTTKAGSQPRTRERERERATFDSTALHKRFLGQIEGLLVEVLNPARARRLFNVSYDWNWTGVSNHRRKLG